jgi:hypothetical protein
MALDLAGFTKDHEGVRHLAVDHPQVREALTYLHQTARDWQVTVTPSERPYLGDIASIIAAQLPGQWEATIEHYPKEQSPRDLLEWLWDSGPYMANLENHRIPCAALLRDGQGTELLLVERPRDGRYLVAALLPSPDCLNVTVPGPRSIAEPNAHLAATAIRVRLLPEYEQAIHLARLSEAEDDLRWAHETFEPGAVHAPYPADLDAALHRFLTHAPHLIAARRRPGAKSLTPQEAAALDHFEAALSPGRGAGLAASDATADESATHAHVMTLWLTEGEQLIEMARDIARQPTTAPVRAEIRTTPPSALPVSTNSAAPRR